MKKILQFLSVCIILISLFTSCSIEKRRYMTGYNIQWKNAKPDIKRNESLQNDTPSGGDKIISAEQSTPDDILYDETVTALADNLKGNMFYIKGKSNQHNNILPEECDVIILRNGDEIKAKISEILQGEIKYNKCEDINGQTFTLKKSEVFMIKYPNGTQDIISADTPIETKNNPTEKEDSGVNGILSFVFAITIYLAPLAIIFGAIGLGKKRKHRGLAIAGLILGIIITIILIGLALDPIGGPR